MKSTEYPEPRHSPGHLLESRNRASQLPKELLELQDYLRQLSAYAEKYKIRDNLARLNTGVRGVSEGEGKWWRKRDFTSREMGFSVKEEIGESSPVQIIEMTPPEEVAVISGNERKRKSEDENEKELSTVISNPVGKSELGPASDDSQIGIYFIEHVKPVNFVNVLQRELSTLGNIFPDVNDIVEQIAHEFNHYKACQKCLEKVSPVLPDILKELQELIRFVKKKRNEAYVWPDDSDYLRKTSEALPKPFGKQVKELQRRKVRQETVAFLTVHTDTPQIIKVCEASVKCEPRGSRQSECSRKCSIGVSHTKQSIFLQPKIQSSFTHFEKAGTADTSASRNDFSENSFLTEFSTSQVLKTLRPGPVFQIVLQYKVRGIIEYFVKEVDSGRDRSNRFLAFTDPELYEEGFQKSLSLEVRESLGTAETVLGKAFFELHTDSRSSSETVSDLKTSVGDLNSLMLEVHKNQTALSKVLQEEEVLNPAIIALTGPRVLRGGKEGLRKAKITLNEANSENPRRDLQCFINKLISKCDVKNRLITSLLKGNVPCEEREELITGGMQDSGSGVQSQTQESSGFFKKSSSTFDENENVIRCQVWNASVRKQFSVEEILSEREIARGKHEPGRNSARMSFSEMLSMKSESSCTLYEVGRMESLSKARSLTMKQLNVETEKLFKDLENEVNCLTFEHNKILCEIEGLKRRKSATDGEKEDNKTPRSGSKTINLTIKIGDQDSMSGYHSALSIVPSGATLKEKKSELSFRATSSEVPQAPATKCSVHEFKSAFNLTKDEFIQESYGAGKSAKSFTNVVLKLKLPVFSTDKDTDYASEGIFQRLTGEKLQNCVPITLDSGSTCATARRSKHSIPRRENVPGSYLGGDFQYNRPSNEEIPDSGIDKALSESRFPDLRPQMNVHCDQNQKMKKLRSRLRFLEKDLRCLRTTIDRMAILTEKLVDDARESSENFRYVSDVFRFLTSRSNI